jgi:hypothetical protein
MTNFKMRPENNPLFSGRILYSLARAAGVATPGQAVIMYAR